MHLTVVVYLCRQELQQVKEQLKKVQGQGQRGVASEWVLLGDKVSDDDDEIAAVYCIRIMMITVHHVRVSPVRCNSAMSERGRLRSSRNRRSRVTEKWPNC
jgi:hypothetical protein